MWRCFVRDQARVPSVAGAGSSLFRKTEQFFFPFFWKLSSKGVLCACAGVCAPVRLRGSTVGAIYGSKHTYPLLCMPYDCLSCGSTAASLYALSQEGAAG